MNATTLFAQKQRLRRPEMNLRVPDLLNFPDKYHNLFYQLGASAFVKCFSAVPLKNSYGLVISLIAGEEETAIIVQRVKTLFQGVTNTVFSENDNESLIKVEIPK